MSDRPKEGAEPEGTPPSGEPPRWLDARRNVDKVFYALCALCVTVTLADMLYDKHGHYAFELLPGFHAVFGFAAYFGLVTAAKQLRRLIKRDEDYYD